MADEATISSSLYISKNNLNYQSLPQSFTADVSGTNGPTPGTVLATVDGTDVDLTALTTFGLCRIVNIDSTNFVDVGIYDPDSTKFYPIMRILAGESYVIRLSPDAEEEYGATGTGTTGADTNRIRIKADTDSVNTIVEAFES